MWQPWRIIYQFLYSCYIRRLKKKKYFREGKNYYFRSQIFNIIHEYPFLSFDQRRQGLISFPAFWIISRYSFTMPGWIKSTGYETYARLFIIISTLSTFSYLHFPTLKDNYVTSYRSIYAGITQLVLYRLNLTNKFDSNLTFNSNFFALNLEKLIHTSINWKRSKVTIIIVAYLFDSITCYIYWIENVSQQKEEGKEKSRVFARLIETLRYSHRIV